MKFLVFLLVLESAAIMVACQPLRCEVNFVKVERKPSEIMDVKDEQQRVRKSIESCKDRTHSHSLTTSLSNFTSDRFLAKTVASPLSYFLYARAAESKPKSFTTNNNLLKSSLNVVH